MLPRKLISLQPLAPRRLQPGCVLHHLSQCRLHLLPAAWRRCLAHCSSCQACKRMGKHTQRHQEGAGAAPHVTACGCAACVSVATQQRKERNSRQAQACMLPRFQVARTSWFNQHEAWHCLHVIRQHLARKSREGVASVGAKLHWRPCKAAALLSTVVAESNSRQAAHLWRPKLVLLRIHNCQLQAGAACSATAASFVGTAGYLHGRRGTGPVRWLSWRRWRWWRRRRWRRRWRALQLT